MNRSTKPAPINALNSEWVSQGATLSDKTACKEFGLTEKEIIQAIRSGKLQFRQQSVFGNPFFRLLRREVESLVKKRRGSTYLKAQRTKTELTRINRQLRRLNLQIAKLEKQKSEITGVVTK